MYEGIERQLWREVVSSCTLTSSRKHTDLQWLK